MILLVTLLPPLLIGYLALRALMPRVAPVWAETLLHVFLGAGLGVGLLSLLQFGIQATIGPSVTAQWIGEVALLAAAGAAFWRRSKEEPSPAPAGSWLLGGFFLIILGIHTASFFHALESLPLGQWDAWAIWNLRAKFLAQQDATWTGAFSAYLSDLPGTFATHPDYPLLLSGYIGRSWALTHSIGDTSVSAAVSALFWAATIAAIVAGLAVVRSATTAMVGGLILLANATFALNAPTQYSDVPLGFFMLSTFVLLLSGGRALALAGFAMGCAAWTKDEGLLFAAVTSAALLVRFPLRQFGMFATGAALPVAATLYFKIFLATGPGSWGPLTFASAMKQIGEPARYQQIIAAFWKEGVAMGAPAIAVLVLGVLLGISRSQLRSPTMQAALAVCALMLLGQFGVYVVTPFDLAWHLGTSLGRVLTQLAPGMTFLLVACCRTPEETAPATATPSPAPKPKRKNR